MIQYPYLQEQPSSRKTLDTFRGLNLNERIGEGELCRMKNLTSDHYPVLSPRKKHGLVGTVPHPVSITGGYYVPGIGVFFSGDEQEGPGSLYFLPPNGGVRQLASDLMPGEKSFALMGKALIVAPDMKWLDTQDLSTVSAMDEKLDVTSGQITVSLCDREGYDYKVTTVAPHPPTENLTHGMIWLDVSNQSRQLHEYLSTTCQWVPIDTTYLKLSGLGSHPFRKGDGIHIEGIGDGTGTRADSLNGDYVVECHTDDGIVITGIVDALWSQDCAEHPVSIERRVPRMDFVVEAGNRLWGCAKDGNEIYASKLGDFKNWNVFSGISTDSWAANVGTPGAFTGAVNQGGYPVFYKQDCKHKIWPASTGAHQLTSIPCSGVLSGCANSTALYGGSVLYLSAKGVCMDDGSGPVVISQKLEPGQYRQGKGTVHGDKYYLSMNGDSSLYVYDLRRGLWHREESRAHGGTISDGTSLYAASGSQIWDLTGNRGTLEEPVAWSATTGDLMLSTPDHQYISRLTLRLSLEQESRLDIYAQYDHEDLWVKLGTAYGRRPGSFSLPLRPRRCDHLRLKLEGLGMGKVYSMTLTLEKGSELE